MINIPVCGRCIHSPQLNAMPVMYHVKPESSELTGTHYIFILVRVSECLASVDSLQVYLLADHVSCSLLQHRLLDDFAAI